jgi:tetratricopeptide (TPR) repeat protein
MSEASRPDRRLPDFAVVAVIVLAVAAIYVQMAWFQFVSWDDPAYVTLNNRVRQGLSWDNLVWAFTAMTASNWHPLTWLSLLLDTSLFGSWAGGFHLSSAAWHLATSLLLYSLLRRMTGELWRPALVAIIWAVHPLHVESVAWVSERKDVMSAAFGLVALHAYLSYARAPSLGRYLLVTVAFVCSLLSKQMLVTFPALLLLIDYWPLQRLTRENWGQRVLEKLPFLGLAIAAAFMTVVAQSIGGAIRTTEEYSLAERFLNAISSYGIYIVKHVWPSDLSFFQVFRTPSLLWVAASLAMIFALTYFAYRRRERTPAMLVGWLWFLGTLVPVIGLVQVGVQAWATRYTYIPSIGLLIMVAWLLPVPDFGRARAVSMGMAAAVAFAVVGFTVRAFIETGYWRNSEILYQRAVALDPRNHVAHTLLAHFYSERGALEPASHHANVAVRLTGAGGPISSNAMLSLSRVLMDLGRFEDALGVLAQVEEIDPNSPTLHYNRGTLEMLRGMPLAALSHFDRAIQLLSGYSEALNNRGVALARLGRLDEAADAHRKAIVADSFNFQAHFNLGAALAAVGRPAEALAAFQSAAKVAPNDVRPKLRVAALLRGMGRQEEARAAYQAVLAIDPGNPTARMEIAR